MSTPNFDLTETGYAFRALHLTDPKQEGWDVYALQTALLGTQVNVGALDGILGPRTKDAICGYQEQRGLVVDGIAGTATQKELALGFTRLQTANFDLPHRLLYGQIEHESTFLLGNQSKMRANWSADCGVAQRNSEHTPPLQGFDVPASILELARNIATKHSSYVEVGVPERRAWELAAGSWNAPAWADTLAQGGDLSASQEAALETYIDAVTPYVNWKGV